MLSRIFIQAFTMTFLAEWGDRSQLATIILAARENVTAVVIAGILGHAFCTGLAVLGKLPTFFITQLRDRVFQSWIVKYLRKKSGKIHFGLSTIHQEEVFNEKFKILFHNFYD